MNWETAMHLSTLLMPCVRDLQNSWKSYDPSWIEVKFFARLEEIETKKVHEL